MTNAEKTAEKWNQANPVGTLVDYVSVTGSEPIGYRTRSEAWVLPSGQAVVQLEGKSGCVALSHVTRREVR